MTQTVHPDQEVTMPTTNTQRLTWRDSFGGGRFTEVNGYKVTVLPSTRKVPAHYVVEPLNTEGLPFKSAKAGGTAKTLVEALALTGRSFCPGCGSTVVAGYVYDPSLACPTR